MASLRNSVNSKMLCAAADFHSRHALWKIRPQALRPVTGLNPPKCFCRTDTGIDELSCPCGYRAWFERGEEGRRRPDSGVAYLVSVGAVTVLCHRSLCYSSAPKTNIRARQSAVQNCSPFKLASPRDIRGRPYEKGPLRKSIGTTRMGRGSAPFSVSTASAPTL